MYNRGPHMVVHVCSSAYKTNHNSISSYIIEEPLFQSRLPTLHSSCSTLHVSLNPAQLDRTNPTHQLSFPTTALHTNTPETRKR
jgi:hypothetical protein